ncbi:MAG TPA: type II CRISPR RNA-guided endonuclease Cas9 [Bacillus bacterium]|nr:type II CRISPR RNA-guided endonuclease Cas9 [Bacillus sp. (in: firmicutes)]
MNNMDYRLGLDIGTSSIGWGLVEMKWDEDDELYDLVGILDKGVRMFDRAEIPKTGASLALPRRIARSTRRRLGRKCDRKQKIRQLIIKNGLISKEQMEKLYPLEHGSIDVWDLRLDGLERLLSGKEWTRLLIHLSQKRGYKSNRKSEENNKETGVVLNSIKENEMRLNIYRTVGEMWMKDEVFASHDKRRNSDDSYLFSISRFQLEQEIRTLFSCQREFGSTIASIELEEDYLKIWNHQLPFASSDDIIKKVGHCSIFHEEKRIPKATYTFQYFSALDALNRVRVGTEYRKLTIDERDEVLTKLFNRKDYFNKKSLPDIKYSDVRKMISLSTEEKFKGLIYDPNATLNQNENQTFLNLKDYYTIHQCLSCYGKQTGVSFTFDDYDIVAHALTIYKTDNDIRNYLLSNRFKNKFTTELIDSFLHLSFSKFGHLSSKAIKILLPEMTKGLTFKEAADVLEVDTTGLTKKTKQKLLPPIPDEMANPIVKRALSQARKVVNEVIRKYGSPLSIHIELARELSKNHEERKKITKGYDENRNKNKAAIAFLLENGIKQPTGFDITRYKLWEEQNQTCAYSINKIPIDVFVKELQKDRSSAPSLDVDHIIPYSQSYMDGYQNKVLVYSDENHKKGNRLPYEYLSTIPGRWEAFEEFVAVTYNTKNNQFKKKRDLLLKKEISEEALFDLKDRHLNDTRYITRYFKNFIEQNLLFKSSMDNRKKKVIAVSGQITSYLRKWWGLNKDRNATFLHHAMDAIVVACADDQMIKRISDYNKQKENGYKKFLTRFPEPWYGFRDDIYTILTEQPIPEELLKKIQFNLDKDYLLVSRAPRYSITGEAHEMTVRKKVGVDKNGKILTTKRIHLRDIKFDANGDFEMVGKDTDLATYNTIKNHYLSFNKNVNVAFSDENLPFKPVKEGKDPTKANKIKKITVMDTAKSYVREINGGITGNGSLVRVDIFKREEKYIMIPIYVADTVLSQLPNKYVKSGKGFEHWPELDSLCEFQFSLYPYDILCVEREASVELLHFVSADISGNKLECKLINSPSDKTEHRFSIGTAKKLVKMKSGILGELYIVKQEKRQSFNRKEKIKMLNENFN